jgi:acetoin utilization deacetylase AcuC-like enzyme
MRNSHGVEACSAPPKDIFARAGFYAFDMSTGICASTWPSALASASLAFHGAKALCTPSSPSPPPRPPSASPPTVLALCRPPGHHCDTRRAGGYCYLNNAVVAVETFRASRIAPSQPSPSIPPPSRIAILDLDFHHGNGTQEAFYADPTVLYISIHGEDEFPYYTGSAGETGASNARGANVNLPLPAHSSAQRYLQELDAGLSALVDFGPDFVVLSLGFDTFHLDPLGSFQIEMEDYAKIAVQVRESLRALRRGEEGDIPCAAGVPCLILLEGGYVIEKLGPNMLSFLKGWEEM